MNQSNSSSDFELKIRQIQRKKKRNLIIKIVSACLVFGLIITYFFLPISKVSNSSISGNIYYTNEEVLKIAGLKEKDSLYLISKDKITKSLKESPLIDDESVKVNIFPSGLKIEYEEVVPVLEYQDQRYLSDGTLLDENLLKSKDPLIGDYLFLHTQDLVKLYSKPFEEKFVASRVEHLSKLILSLEEGVKGKIVGVSYDSSSYYYSFYFDTGLEDGTLLKIVFDSAKKIEDLNVIIENEKIERYISYLTDELTKDNFVGFEENIEGVNRKVKSIKIVMQTIDGEIYYHVKYNNPPLSE